MKGDSMRSVEELVSLLEHHQDEAEMHERLSAQIEDELRQRTGCDCLALGLCCEGHGEI